MTPHARRAIAAWTLASLIVWVGLLWLVLR
jgi:hypothetical protein